MGILRARVIPGINLFFSSKLMKCKETHGVLPGPNWLSIGKEFKFIAKKAETGSP